MGRCLPRQSLAVFAPTEHVYCLQQQELLVRLHVGHSHAFPWAVMRGNNGVDRQQHRYTTKARGAASPAGALLTTRGDDGARSWTHPPVWMEDREGEVLHNLVVVVAAVRLYLHANREALQAQVKVLAFRALDARHM